MSEVYKARVSCFWYKLKSIRAAHQEGLSHMAWPVTWWHCPCGCHLHFSAVPLWCGEQPGQSLDSASDGPMSRVRTSCSRASHCRVWLSTTWCPCPCPKADLLSSSSLYFLRPCMGSGPGGAIDGWETNVWVHQLVQWAHIWGSTQFRKMMWVWFLYLF